ncbi:MAG TPA: hypothetical protein VGQ03_03730 [Nitrososphaera sp.]|jgi:Na+/melibiose symporter-like transporter|nr:hypothetical protein [Nitrososphaera sp.]
MGLASLALFVSGMWLMVLGVAAFLVIFVAPIDVTVFGGQGSAANISLVQAAIAIVAVIALVFGLSRMKRIYLQKKLKQ